ncbi:uncharacterized protein MELLADRAFT_89590 [Melampsora larici-populina 98AG31]|uniref:Uncharacterized protein n=1 Tax=Melampsora larici-populina (strain 98AG31 / pathotype 3-4-7) TaxID=747676 RepID=F4RTW9_MELLP|nr:uncharacterized protein MELLADRAFT_89590 [Melampsora larici-populina 98AG31]EGG04078.1 hypothetical protein MELLADRAFT_89590 [Melampsora larici-populina 98AG31]
MPLPTLMFAILPNLDDATRVDPTEDGAGWHTSNTHLTLKAPDGGHVFEPLTALGYVRPDHKLERAKAYSIIGPFGHDVISGKSIIEHCRDTKKEVIINPQEYEHLAGKAVVNGLGMIVDFYFEDVDDVTGWELTVNAKHDWFDPRVSRFKQIVVHYAATESSRFWPIQTEELKEFVITYHFVLFTPISFDWPQIAVGAKMMLHGSVIRKDPISGWFIVKSEFVNHLLVFWNGSLLPDQLLS